MRIFGTGFDCLGSMSTIMITSMSTSTIMSKIMSMSKNKLKEGQELKDNLAR